MLTDDTAKAWWSQGRRGHRLQRTLTSSLGAAAFVACFAACGGRLVGLEPDTTVDGAVRPPTIPIHIQTFSAETHHYSYFGYSPDGTCLSGYYAAHLNHDGTGVATANCLDSTHQLAAPIYNKPIDLRYAQMAVLRTCASVHPLDDVDFTKVDGTSGTCVEGADIYTVTIIENGATYAFT